MVSTRHGDGSGLPNGERRTRGKVSLDAERPKDQRSRRSSGQVVNKQTRHSSRIATLPASNLVDLDSDSDQELPNPKRTPVAASKRKRAFVQEDSPEAAEHVQHQTQSENNTQEHAGATQRLTRSGQISAHRPSSHKPKPHGQANGKGKQAVTEFERRYPSRLRRSLSQPESAQGSGHQGSTSKDEESGSDQAQQSGEEEEERLGSEDDEEEEEGEEEEEEEAEAEQAEKRKQYHLRERRPVQQASLYQPSFGSRDSKRSRLLRGAQVRKRNRFSSKPSRPTYAEDWSDDDVLDHPAAAWKGLQGAADGLPWEGPRAGAGPAGAGALQPYGQGGAAGAVPGQARERSGNAEITPLEVDPSVSFDQVGGLNHYIKALKEMVFLPLVYPELFERFHLSPPRGVLFYGPPGTGKTLVARALAATASKAGTKVSFFMRKGADVLSKWVGEAERQLRLLFEEAQKAQPSIIFFDEIDGLAPVRSSKQDQIHNSIVSTLLALMDGLDSRGQVVVIGATNRLDALDGALRRPGRFDRELVFPLPNLQARASILDIHTRKWSQPPAQELQQELANRCVGYCGADLKALCTEASLHALRRQYPQIYSTTHKLLIDPALVTVARTDFLAAFKAVTPSSHRSAVAHARPLPDGVAPCLGNPFNAILTHLKAIFPPAAACLAKQDSPHGAAQAPNSTTSGTADHQSSSDGDDDEEGAWDEPLLGSALPYQQVQRPRLLICGAEGAGQAHLGPALLYALEGLPVHALGLPSLLSDASARSPEEAVVRAVIEARRAAPAILFLPHLQLWWETAPASLKATLTMLLADLPQDLPLLLLATADSPADELEAEALKLFSSGGTGVYTLSGPTADERRSMFKGLTEQMAMPPRPALTRKRKAPEPPTLPRAPEAVVAEEEAEQAKRAQQQQAEYNRDVQAVTKLRRHMRKIVASLIAKSKFADFLYPISPGNNPEAYYKVKRHMDLGTLLHHIDHHMYPTTAPFLADVAIIPEAWAQYYEGSSELQGVSKEALLMPSKARQLADDIREGITALPQGLNALCQAISARGGPKPPPGMEDEAEMLTGVTGAVPPAKAASDIVVGRSSKRLRGETVETLSVFDDPEAAARRLRQAMQTDPTTNPNPAANPSRQHRAVHFQEPSALPSEPAALREGEDELLPEEEHVKHMDDVDGTPHTGVTHPGLEPSSGASGLRLSLSTTTSAAQPPGSAAQASHVHTAAEPLQVPLTAQNVHSPSGAKPSHLHSATHTQDAAAQHPHSGPHQQSMAQPAGNSSSAALHAVPAEDAPMPQAPNTAGRAVASSQDSLRIAAERAAAIASLQAVAAAGVAATTSFSVGSPAANAAGAVPETALHQMHAASGAGANGVTDRDIGITNQDSRQAPALLHGEDQMQLDRDITLSGGVSEAQKPGQLQRARRQEEVQRDDDSTVLASTTRPNVPDNKRVTIMAGKSMPTHQKTSTNKQVEDDDFALRAVHAGHTPHPSKARPPHPLGSPMLAQSTVKGRPTAIPAYMQQEGIPAAAPLTFQSPAGDAPYPSSHVAPVDDTPMPQADLISQSPAVLVPDSCVGQVALTRDHTSMQSVRKSSLCLEEDEAEPDFPGNESPQLINEHSFVSEQRPVAISERVQAGSESEQAAEPQVHVTQQCQAFEDRLVCATEGLVLEKLEDICACLGRLVWQHRHTIDRSHVIQAANAALATMGLL